MDIKSDDLATGRPIDPHAHATRVRDSLTLTRIFGILFRRWLLILVLTLVPAAGAWFTIQKLPERYVAQAQILLPSQARGAVPFSVFSSEPIADPESARTEMLLLQSPALIRSTAESLNLKDSPEFAAVRAKEARAPSDVPAGLVERELLGQELARRLSVARLGESLVASVSAWAHDPAEASRMVNGYIDQYLHWQAQAKTTVARHLEDSLQGPLRELQDSVRAADQAVERFRKESGILDLEASPLIVRQILSLNEQLVAVRAARAELASRLQFSGSAENNPRELSVQIQREESLEQELKQLRAEYERQNEARIRLRELEREASTSRAVLDAFLERFKQTQIQAAMQRPSAVVLFRAEQPVLPASPKRTLLFVAAVAGAFAFSVAVALAVDLQSRRAHRA